MIRLVALSFLLAYAASKNTDSVSKKDVNSIERRLRIIEDTIAEERLQRRDDVQSVLVKLSELQNTLNENYGSQKISNEANVYNGFAGDEYVMALLTKIINAFATEKRINQRFRREMQHKRLEKTNTCVEMTDVKSELVKNVESLKIRHAQTKRLGEKLSKFMKKSATFATKSDISTIEDVITEMCIKVPQDVSELVSEKLKVFEIQRTDLEQVQNALFNMTQELVRINRKTTEVGEICREEVQNREAIKESPYEELPVKKESRDNKEQHVQMPGSCVDLYDAGFTDNGVYEIKVKERVIDVYCDQTTDGGGWMVFQRRQDGSVDFNRTWGEYKYGFGDLEGEFWLGNNNLAELTENCCHELRIDIRNFKGNTAHAKYGKFEILSEENLYELNLEGYSGDAGNSLEYHNKMKFSTKDSDNDLSGNSCSVLFGGGWWFRGCLMAYLNGKYHVNGEIKGHEQSRLDWIDWDKRLLNGLLYSLTFSEMKLK